MAANYSITATSCRVCRHRARHRIDTLGKTRCEECPDEICVAKQAETESVTEESPIIRHTLLGGTLDTFKSPVGIAIIHEMTKGEMIAELLAFNAEKLEKLPPEELRLAIARTRAYTSSKAIYDEAGVTEQQRWGWLFE